MKEYYDIVYSPEALDDLENIYCYIAYELMSPDTAENQVNHIRILYGGMDTESMMNP